MHDVGGVGDDVLWVRGVLREDRISFASLSPSKIVLFRRFLLCNVSDIAGCVPVESGTFVTSL